MKIAGIDIDIDIEEYLRQKGLSGIRHVGYNVMACCPFHDDRSPSFGVNLETGAYNCFGCGAKGSFVQLVKELDHFDTVFDAEDFLIRMYGRYSVTGVDEPLDLEFEDEQVSEPYHIPEETLLQYRWRHPYLTKRGISERVQRIFGIGYSQDHRAITIPWRDHKGRLLTVKMRRTFGKAFWFEPPMPLRVKASTLWSLEKVLTWGLQKVAITEGEIDALSVWQVEMVGVVALGGNVLTDEQASRLRQTLKPDTEIIVFTDSDQGGERAKRSIVDKLSGDFLVTAVDWTLVSGQPKDANDLDADQIKMLLEKRKNVGLNLGWSEQTV